MEQQEVQTLRALMEYEAARTEPPESFPHLPDIPAGRYTDPRFFELEQAEIFKKSWLFAAHLDEIPEPNEPKDVAAEEFKTPKIRYRERTPKVDDGERTPKVRDEVISQAIIKEAKAEAEAEQQRLLEEMTKLE